MPTGSWTMSGDTVQRSEKGGPSWTKNEYGNFQMDFEVQIPKGGNTGVFLRGKDPKLNQPINVLELELIDGPTAGGLSGILYPKQPITLADGNWHQFSILAKDHSITVSHNGRELYTCDFSKCARATFNPDGTRNNYKIPLKDLPLKGRIGFQGYLGAVKFRNIAIKEL